jgi:hypothetical protein
MDLTMLLRITLKSVSEDAAWLVFEGRLVRLDVLPDGTVTARSNRFGDIPGAIIIRLNNLRPNKKGSPDG